MRLYLLIMCITLFSCSSYECSKYDDKSASEISTILQSLDKSALSHELYLLGECHVQAALPVLEIYLHDPRISHHKLHKGMSISYIADNSIKKIQKEKFSTTEKNGHF